MATSKQKQAKGSNGDGSLYSASVTEIETLAKDASYRKRIEDGPINEARGHDAWVLHTILKAVSDGDRSGEDRTTDLTRQIEGVSGLVEKAMAQQVSLTDDLGKRVDAFREHHGENHAALVSLVEDKSSLLSAEVENGFGEVSSAVDATHEEVKASQESVAGRIGKAQDAIAGQLDAAQESLLERIDGTTDRISGENRAFREAVEEEFSQTRHLLTAELDELRDEFTKLVDRGFNQMDQSFASVRSDLEVVKFLVMDLIRDRLGRTEVKGKTL